MSSSQKPCCFQRRVELLHGLHREQNVLIEQQQLFVGEQLWLRQLKVTNHLWLNVIETRINTWGDALRNRDGALIWHGYIPITVQWAPFDHASTLLVPPPAIVAPQTMVFESLTARTMPSELAAAGSAANLTGVVVNCAAVLTTGTQLAPSAEVMLPVPVPRT